MRGGEGVAGSQPMITAVRRSPNKLWRSNSIFNLLFISKVYILIWPQEVTLESLERAYETEEFHIASWRSHHRLELAIGTYTRCTLSSSKEELSKIVSVSCEIFYHSYMKTRKRALAASTIRLQGWSSHKVCGLGPQAILGVWFRHSAHLLYSICQ